MQFTIDFLENMYSECIDDELENDIDTLFSAWHYDSRTYLEVLRKNTKDYKVIKRLEEKITELQNRMI